MKIIKLHIDNFGKLSNLDISFGGGINQICAENGWGKTTLAVFLKAMFYGMGASRDNVKMERKKYMPWQGGNYGGYVEFKSEKGAYRITRNFAKTPEGDENQLIDLSLNKEVSFPKEGLGEWLFGVGKDTFEMTAFFPQMNILTSANEQISAGVLGLDKFKFDLASVGDGLAKIKKEISAQKKNAVKESDVERIKKQLSQIKIELASIEKEKKNFEKEKQTKLQQINSLSSETMVEKENLKTQEELFASKLKVEEEIKAKNEELSSLLMKLNSLHQTKTDPQKVEEKKKQSFLWLAGVGIALIGIVLGVANVFSWLIAGVISGVGLALSLILFLISKGKKGEKIESVAVQPNEEEALLTQKIEQCKAQLEQLTINAQVFANVQNPNNQKFQLLQEKFYSEKIELEKIAVRIQNLQIDKENLLEEEENLTQTLTLKTQQKDAVEAKLDLLDKTSQFLLQAKENVSARFVGPINKEFSSLLAKFDVRGREFVVDTNFDIKENATSGVKPFEHSSQGYQDILSFCMRFLLLKQVFKGEEPFVVLDDSFVNLDDVNFAKAKEILKEFARENQIIYICCNEKSKIK